MSTIRGHAIGLTEWSRRDPWRERMGVAIEKHFWRGTWCGAKPVVTPTSVRTNISNVHLINEQGGATGMDPVTVTIVSALAAGAKDVATSAVKDAYAGLKRLITDRYERAVPSAENVEADPASEPFNLFRDRRPKRSRKPAALWVGTEHEPT